MTAAIGLAVAKAAVGSISAGFNIKDSVREENLKILQISERIVAERMLMRRRIAEASLQLAGIESDIDASLSGVIEGRSLDLAVLNVASKFARAVSDDVFATKNRERALFRQAEEARIQGRRQRVNAVLKIVGAGISAGKQIGDIGAAQSAINDSLDATSDDIVPTTSNTTSGITGDIDLFNIEGVPTT